MTPLEDDVRIRRRCRPGSDQGSALVLVLGSMVVLTMLLITTSAFALRNLGPANDDQDAKAAIAAAQAGVDDYLSRLNVNNDYWQTGEGVTATRTLPGTSGAVFSYERLGSIADVANAGSLRLKVTGKVGRAKRTLVATLAPAGFLKYVYYTDVEATDPALYADRYLVNVQGETDANGSATSYYVADPATVRAKCSRHYYEGRTTDLTYTSSAATPYYEVTVKNNGSTTTATGVNGRVVTLRSGCNNLQWATGDVLDGPMHSNDALRIEGPVVFRNSDPSSKAPASATSWADGSTPAPSANRWWTTSGGAPDASSGLPVYAPPVDLPDSNGSLLVSATNNGCVYTGATKITFSGATMNVLSPNTTTTKAGCFNAANKAVVQAISPIPPVIYVNGSTASPCTAVGYPLTVGGKTEAKLGAVPDHACTKGNAYVSGKLAGRTTIGTADDVVIVGDLTYAGGPATPGGPTGTDVLGLIANNNVFVYHPVSATGVSSCTPSGNVDYPHTFCKGENMLAPAAEVHNVQAAILSLQHSFLVQSSEYGAQLNAGAQKLNVFGAIAQKFRGQVGSTQSGVVTGYAKNYLYDKRLLAIPPPFFLQPKTTPWYVKETSG